jgi:quinol-cytochrome oxidoreductase complex cytochrome b subunit
MLRCAASFVIATYAEVGRVPQYLRALPLAYFTKSSPIWYFATFYEIINSKSKRSLLWQLSPAGNHGECLGMPGGIVGFINPPRRNSVAYSLPP